jgi:[ribosomal protein S5]-alanine N-acetyltransferase
MIPAKELRTSRLILRPLEYGHLDCMLPLISAREVAATTLRIPHPYTRKDAEDYFRAMEIEIGKGKMLRLSIFIAPSDEYCGSVGLHIEREHGRAEMGYWIGVPFWGRGYASEAARAVVEYGFSELGLNRIFATVFGGNTASRRVAEKAGMKYEGCMRQHVNKWEQLLDMEIYGVLAADWRKARKTS